MESTPIFNPIRIIFINPFAKVIEERWIKPDFEAMKADLMGCDYAQPIELGGGVVAWVDENGLLMEDWSKQGFTAFLAPGVGGDPLTLAGNIVLAGEGPDGDLASIPEFMNAEVVAQTIRPVEPKDARLPGPKMTVIGPDGSHETIPLGPEWLTFDNH